MARNLLINAHGNLEVLSQVKCDPYDINFPLLGRKNMALYKLELNMNNGDVVNEINYYCDDTTYIQSNFDGFYLKEVSKFYAINDTFYFTQGEWTGNNWEYQINKIMNSFIKEKILTKNFLKKYNCYGDLPIFFNDSTRIVFNSNCNTRQLEMIYIDNNFNEINSIISDTLSKKLNELQVKKFDPINRKFLLENVVNFDTREIELIVINDKGQLLKRIIMPNIYNRNYCILEWDNIDSIVFLAPLSHDTYTDHPYVTLDVLKSNRSGNINVSYSFLPSDSLRYLSYINLVTSNDEKYYYLEVNESSLKKSQIKYEIDFNASAKSMLKLDKKLILNPITKTNSIILDKISCFPNPTSGLIRIEGLKHATFLSIYDLNGNLIKAYPNITNQINVDELSSGIYIFEFRNNNQINRQKIIIIN